MINYHKILEMHLQGISQRTISSSTGHSRDKIREVVNVYYDEVEQMIIAFNLYQPCGSFYQ